MTPRERLVSALNHREPDRVPFDLGGTIVTSITEKAYTALRRHLGMQEEQVKMYDHVQQLPYLDEELLERLCVDVRMVHTPYVSAKNQRYSQDDGYYSFIDRWGSKLRMPKEGGFYFDWVEFPITEICQEALADYRWPEPDRREAILELKAQARELWENTDYGVLGTGVFGGGIFEQPARIMGVERFLESLVLNEKFAATAMDKIVELYIENSINYLEEIGQFINVYIYWNDMSGQNGPMISPEIYRRLIKPRDRRLIEMVKSKTEAKVFYHCCGAVREFIPDLIEIGVDILNPVQVSARGMDTRELKREFGKDIAFWGGGCDTQKILPFGTPEQVREEVKRRIDDLAPGGGFVFNAVHNIQAGVPPENIMAMIEALQEHGC